MKVVERKRKFLSGEYKYEWTLVEHPTGDGEQVGHMEDINTANLKLSQVQIYP